MITLVVCTSLHPYSPSLWRLFPCRNNYEGHLPPPSFLRVLSPTQVYSQYQLTKEILRNGKFFYRDVIKKVSYHINGSSTFYGNARGTLRDTRNWNHM